MAGAGWRSALSIAQTRDGLAVRLEITALFRKVDCHSIPVADLDAALAFYRDGLGYELIWRDDSAAGLRLPDSDAELVLHTEKRPIETDLLVTSVPAAISRFCGCGREGG